MPKKTTRSPNMTDKELGEFLATGIKVLINIGKKLGPELAQNWATNEEAMEAVIGRELIPSELRMRSRDIFDPGFSANGIKRGLQRRSRSPRSSK